MIDGFTCASCAATAARRWRDQDGWQIVRCESCSLLATWPRPDEASISRLYETSGYFDERGMGADSSQPQAWRSRVRGIVGLLGAPEGPLLDFGAGPGHFVGAARSLGMEIDGIEPSETARALALERYGVELLPGMPRPHAERRYAAVTLTHVLEHVPDPVGDLERLRSLLAPGGTVFIEVPNAGSADMWLPSRRRQILDLPAHLHHFTPKTLRDVVAGAGYEVRELRLFNPYPLERLLAARRRARPGAAASVAESPQQAPAAGPPGALWPRALERVRSVFPGDKLQLVARAST